MALRQRSLRPRRIAAPIRPKRRKISATLEEDVVREIQAVTANLSEFLNEAAKRQLYVARVKKFDEQLERRGVEVDWRLYRWLEEKVVTARPRLRR